MRSRTFAILAVNTLLGAACHGGGSGSGSPATPSPTIVAVNVPPGTPPSYAKDVDVADLPAETLVPTGTSATDSWNAVGPDGQQFAIIAYAAPSDDPLHQERGVVVWRRFADAPPWRPVFALTDPADAGVLQIHAQIGDVTGDGSPDAIVFEDVGGSGACGRWRVLDLTANTQVYERRTCDTMIDVSADPVGLEIREAVYRNGDAHCCPTATRTTVLRYAGDGRWDVASRVVTQNT